MFIIIQAEIWNCSLNLHVVKASTIGLVIRLYFCQDQMINALKLFESIVRFVRKLIEVACCKLHPHSLEIFTSSILRIINFIILCQPMYRKSLISLHDLSTSYKFRDSIKTPFTRNIHATLILRDNYWIFYIFCLNKTQFTTKILDFLHKQNHFFVISIFILQIMIFYF